jgi:hypothetical protein
MRFHHGTRLKFVVDNTYKRIPLNEASLDWTQTHHRVHKFTLFVDVISGNPDMITSVTFDLGPTFHPRVFKCVYPLFIRQSHTGNLAYRFSTTQTVYGAIKAKIIIRGCGVIFLQLFMYKLSSPQEIFLHQ